MIGLIKITFGQCIKTIKKTKHQKKIHLRYVKLTHQLSVRNMNMNMGHHTGGKWFIHGPQHRMGNPLQWRHNGRDSVSNHQPHDCFLNRLFRRRSKKTSKLRVTGLCAGNSPGPVNSPHKGLVTRKISIWWRHHELLSLKHSFQLSWV